MAKKKDGNNKLLIGIIVLILIGAGIFFFLKIQEQQKLSKINSFEECVNAGFPIMESYPPQCKVSTRSFTQDIGNELKYTDEIQVTSPGAGGKISSPVTIEGKARGMWFFEGSLKATVFDEANNRLEEVVLTARGDWMSEDFVPFSGMGTFQSPTTKKGRIIINNANPSGLEENQKELIIPVTF